MSGLFIDIERAFHAAGELRTRADDGVSNGTNPVDVVMSSGSIVYLMVGLPHHDAIHEAAQLSGTARLAISEQLELLARAVEFGAADTLAADTTGVTSGYHPSAFDPHGPV